MDGFDLFIAPDGSISAIHDDELTPELAQHAASKDDIKLRRASHVEAYADLSEAAREALGDVDPAPLDWWVDLTPSSGPVLGPFKSRQAALDAEVEWLLDNGLGAPAD